MTHDEIIKFLSSVDEIMLSVRRRLGRTRTNSVGSDTSSVYTVDSPRSSMSGSRERTTDVSVAKSLNFGTAPPSRPIRVNFSRPEFGDGFGFGVGTTGTALMSRFFVG